MTSPTSAGSAIAPTVRLFPAPLCARFPIRRLLHLARRLLPRAALAGQQQQDSVVAPAGFRRAIAVI
jgi:hypothetical protein